MEIHVEGVGIYDAGGDVGAVVGDALQVGQKVRPDEAGLDAAVALLEAQDVLGAEVLFHAVDDLPKGLDAGGGIGVVIGEGLVFEAPFFFC